MPIFWTAIRYLEKINLKVISVTADGTSLNRKFFRIHKFMDEDAGENVVYRARNIYAKEKRFIFFFSIFIVWGVLIEIHRQIFKNWSLPPPPPPYSPTIKHGKVML